MKRTTIDFGLDLGTTNSAISKMHNGDAESIRTNTLKDTMPSCVFINRRKAIQVGDAAFNALKDEKLNAMKDWDSSKDNSFIEFKRTMGSDAMYESSNAERSFSSIELSAEVLKTLKSFEKNENINSVVITVPAAFKNNQIDATRAAGKEAGFSQVGIITEPEAAAWSYGMNSENNDGYWLVFDFGGGTFDAALLKVTDGIRQVLDTAGDNYLGGKNLDEEIVEKIIIPHLKENFSLDNLMEDNNKMNILRNAMKFYAEDIKKQLSFNDEADILTNLGDIPGEDDEGEEFELDFTVTESELEVAIRPVFQKAIDVSNSLLERNNLQGDKLSALILVGGPTYSPILRRMLEEQICKPDTSVDPMTAVSKGAAIYASTVKKDESIIEVDASKIQLEITHEAASVEEEEYVTMKILDEKTEGPIPTTVFAEISRGDGGWSSGKVEINNIGELFTVQLQKGRLNSYTVNLYDEKGNLLESEPSLFNIIGSGTGGNPVLPYNIGIELQDISSGRLQFSAVTGLEKSKQLPAAGNLSSLKTPRQIRPGMKDDYLEISIYQGEENSEGTRAVHNHHVSTIFITGNEFPALLPENSEVDIELNIDINQKITGLATFPHLAFTYEFECETQVDRVDSSNADYLDNEIKKAKADINELKSKGVHSNELLQVEKDLDEIEEHYSKNKLGADTQQQTIENLRKALIVVDRLIGEREWPELEKELRETFHKLEEINRDKGNEQTTQIVNRLRSDTEEAIQNKDKRTAPQLIEMIKSVTFELERLEHLISFILYFDSEFESIPWNDRAAARASIERGKQIIYDAPSIDRLQPIVIDLGDNGNFGKGVTRPGASVPKGGTLRR